MLAKAYLLIEELDDVLQGVIQSGDPELLKKKQQIEVINSTMNQLLACGLPVPDDLISRKKSLEADIAWMDDPDIALPLIRDELLEIINYIDGYFIKSGNQPANREVEGNKKPSLNSERKINNYKPGEITDREKLKAVLIDVLRDMGGSGRVAEIKDEMVIRIGDQLTVKDKEIISNGSVRWWNNTQWIRQRLVDSGVLKGNSPRGVWELK